jgi:hypothetical protein
MAILEMLSGAVPGFWTATVRAALAVPTDWAGKSSMDEENDSSGASAETVNGTVPEVPPPGVGFVTVTEAVPLLVKSEAGTVVISVVVAT